MRLFANIRGYLRQSDMSDSYVICQFPRYWHKGRVGSQIATTYLLVWMVL